MITVVDNLTYAHVSSPVDGFTNMVNNVYVQAIKDATRQLDTGGEEVTVFLSGRFMPPAEVPYLDIRSSNQDLKQTIRQIAAGIRIT